MQTEEYIKPVNQKPISEHQKFQNYIAKNSKTEKDLGWRGKCNLMWKETVENVLFL